MSEARLDSNELLSEAAQALDDWITIYAHEMCRPEVVEQARKRVFKGGGTIAYAANIADRLRKAATDNEKG